MHAHTLGCMEACAIRGDVRFVVLRRSSHATAHTHLLQHLFAVVAQLLVGDEDDRSLGLRASTDGKNTHAARTRAHTECPQRGGGASPVASTPSAHVVYQGGCMLLMMWVRSSRTQMMTRKIIRHKVTYTVKVHGQGGASKCLDVLRASTIELSQRAIRNTPSFPVYKAYLNFSVFPI